MIDQDITPSSVDAVLLDEGVKLSTLSPDEHTLCRFVVAASMIKAPLSVVTPHNPCKPIKVGVVMHRCGLGTFGATFIRRQYDDRAAIEGRFARLMDRLRVKPLANAPVKGCQYISVIEGELVTCGKRARGNYCREHYEKTAPMASQSTVRSDLPNLIQKGR